MGSADRDSVYSAYGQMQSIGLSTITGITAIAGLNAIQITHFAGGTLELVGFNSAGASLTWGQGGLFLPFEPVSIDCSGNLYLAATGATVTVRILRGRSAGIST